MKNLKKALPVLLVLAMTLSVTLMLASCGKKAVEQIAVNASAAVTEFKVGDAFDSKGLKITAKYEDGTTETIDPANCSYSGYDASAKVTGQVITVTYEGKTATYKINVTNPSALTGNVYYGQTQPVSMTIQNPETGEDVTTESTSAATIEIVDGDTLIYGSDVMMGVWGYWDCTYTTDASGALTITVGDYNEDLSNDALMQYDFAKQQAQARPGLLVLKVKLSAGKTDVQVGTDRETMTPIMEQNYTFEAAN